MSLSQIPPALICPNCGRVVAQLVTTKAGEILGCDECAHDLISVACTLSTEQWEAAESVKNALALFGLTNVVASKVPTSPAKQQRAHVWKITAGAQHFILKRCHEWLADDAIRYEHSILTYLSTQRFPVAAPMQVAGGATWVVHAGARWVLYPALSGEHLSTDQWNFNLGRAADTLARIHLALKDFTPAGAPHPSWEAPTLQQIDTMMASWPELPDLTPKLLSDVRARLASGFFATGATSLPRTIVHGEFTTANVLWENGTISGVLDFERAHPNTPLWDFATGMWTRFPPVLRAVVALYSKVWPFADYEREAIPDAILLGAVLGIDAQLNVYRQPAEAVRRAKDLELAYRGLEQLRKIAGCPPH